MVSHVGLKVELQELWARGGGAPPSQSHSDLHPDPSFHEGPSGAGGGAHEPTARPVSPIQVRGATPESLVLASGTEEDKDNPGRSHARDECALTSFWPLSWL